LFSGSITALYEPAATPRKPAEAVCGTVRAEARIIAAEGWMTLERGGPRIAVFLCALMMVAAMGRAAQASPAIVRGIGVRWSPSAVTVARGSVVRWRGVSKFHDVVSYGSNWSFAKALPAGSQVKRRFRTSGTFFFRAPTTPP
jgi:plastocyanin